MLTSLPEMQQVPTEVIWNDQGRGWMGKMPMNGAFPVSTDHTALQVLWGPFCWLAGAPLPHGPSSASFLITSWGDRPVLVTQ
jgi:hypothetical protein